MIREVKSIKSNEEVKAYLKGVIADLDKVLRDNWQPQMDPPPMGGQKKSQQKEEETFEQRVLEITNKIIAEANKPENAERRDEILSRLDKLRPVLVGMGAMD